jgi:cytochrome c biogenesis protein CcdA
LKPASANRRPLFFPEDQNISTILLRRSHANAEGPDSGPEEGREPHREPCAVEGRSRAFRRGGHFEIAASPEIRCASTCAHILGFAALARIVGLAFLGGLLLNLMPCVFPVLFLKGLALVNSGNEERTSCARMVLSMRPAFWFHSGCWWRAARTARGRRHARLGIPVPVAGFLSLMAGLLFFLGLSLAGQFEIGLTLTSAGGSLAAKQGYTGSFFTGVLAVVVATPCTAPFMGAAIGYALAQPAAVTSPSSRRWRSAWPRLMSRSRFNRRGRGLLPKPGAWMEVLQAGRLGADLCHRDLAGVGAGLRANLLLATALLLAIAGSSAAAGEAFSSLLILADCRAWLRRKVGPRHPGRAKRCGQQLDERVALDRPEVMQAFAAANVALFRADWTREDPAITQALTDLGRSGVPVYALYTPGQSAPQLLPQVLTPGIVIDALSKVPRAATQVAPPSSNP